VFEGDHFSSHSLAKVLGKEKAQMGDEVEKKKCFSLFMEK
jgi:hypothetical protein